VQLALNLGVASVVLVFMAPFFVLVLHFDSPSNTGLRTWQEQAVYLWNVGWHGVEAVEEWIQCWRRPVAWLQRSGESWIFIRC